jgi:hypothetical protein
LIRERDNVLVDVSDFDGVMDWILHLEWNTSEVKLKKGKLQWQQSNNSDVICLSQ